MTLDSPILLSCALPPGAAAAPSGILLSRIGRNEEGAEDENGGGQELDDNVQ